MPIGLLVMLAFFGGCTALALAPWRRPGPLAMLSYGVNELPHVAAVLVIGSTALAYSQGALHGLGGFGAASLAALTVLSLGILLARSLRARPAVDAALRDALPDAPEARPEPATFRGTLRTMLTPFPTRPRDVVRVRDRSYGPAGRRNRLDVYHRRSSPSAAPILVYFHGGGYFGGAKHRESRALLHRFAARGWVCVSANYRLRPAASFPDHLVDAKRVIAWVRENAAEFGADTTTLVVCGSSAGGHLAALVALSPNDPVFQPGFEEADTRVTAAIGFYGFYGRYYGRDEGEQPSSSPLDYDASSAPPFMLVLGDHDNTYFPVELARTFAQHLRAASAEPVVYVELPGGQHAFDLYHSLRFEAVLDGVDAFVDQILLERPAGAPGCSSWRRGIAG
jgi:acetyl esterase/lipase